MPVYDIFPFMPGGLHLFWMSKRGTATDASNSFQGIPQVGYIEKAGDEQYCFFGQIAEIGLNP